MLSLSNSHLDFSFDLNTAHWSVHPGQQARPLLAEVRLGAAFHLPSGRAFTWDGTAREINVSTMAGVDSPHGHLTVRTVRLAALSGLHEAHLKRKLKAGPELFAKAELSGLEWLVEFALPATRPFLLWRVTARNTGAQPFALDGIDLAVSRAAFQGARSALAFFSNGFQSWSFAGTLQADMLQPDSIFGALGDPKPVNLGTPRVWQPGHFTSEMFGVLGDRENRVGLVTGFLSQREQFGHVETHLDSPAPFLRLAAQCDGVLLPPGGERLTDWAYLQFIQLDDPDPLAEYAAAVAREANGGTDCAPEHTPVGWCSWYHYFDNVTETDITDNLEVLARERPRLPLDFVQLDDGYQANVGDWFETNAKFPHGLPWLTEQIRARGHTPGLWLAPYILRPDARLVQEHPEWILRLANGRPATAGFNWGKWCYGLDPTHPGVREHVRRLITTAVQSWGFPYLKLDFLYAAALPAQRSDATLTRAQAMRLALQDMRSAAGPDTFILGCGCPLGSAVGLVNGMRISTDVAPNWSPHVFSPLTAPILRDEVDFPSVRNAIRNTINRAPLHRRWWLNDPDCLMARDRNTRLSEPEVRSLATVIALSGGMFLVSDDMRRLNVERQRYIAPLLPVLAANARPLDWLSGVMPDVLTLPLAGPMEPWQVVGIFNWDDRARAHTLDLRRLGLDPGSDYYISDFWERRLWKQKGAEPLQFDTIPPHGAYLVALRRVTDQPTLVASSFHFSQGGEIRAWQATAHGLTLTMELGRVAYGELRLALPAAPHQVTIDGRPMPATPLGDHLYSVVFAVNRTAEVCIMWTT